LKNNNNNNLKIQKNLSLNVSSSRIKYLWCGGRTEKISWTDRVKNEKVLHRVKEVSKIKDAIKRGKVN